MSKLKKKSLVDWLTNKKHLNFSGITQRIYFTHIFSGGLIFRVGSN